MNIFFCLPQMCFIKYIDKYQANGNNVTELGLHSIRKGAATQCREEVRPAPPL